tara:strand:- start:723 stop:890 length:168 start_codon:yes stop_codon:yes gene_type:complete
MTKNNFLFLALIFIFSCSDHDFDILIINGIIVVEDGIHNGKRPGRILYGPGYREK